MKTYFPDDYCPQREKVLDLSRSVMSGNRGYARQRRQSGRHRAKVDRQLWRDRLSRAATWSCSCAGDPDIDCGRCYSDDLPTISETHGGWGLPVKPGVCTLYGLADDLAQLYRWYQDRTKGMNHYEVETFLRTMFLSSVTGNSLKTRHAYDHLLWEIARFRMNGYTFGGFFGGRDWVISMFFGYQEWETRQRELAAVTDASQTTQLNVCHAVVGPLVHEQRCA